MALKYYAPTKLSENIRETPEGFLVCLGVPVARTGWMEYGEGETPLEVGDDGIVRIYRDETEVFRPETIASFEGKAVTIKHPEDFVSPENWSELAKGSMMNVRKGEEDEDGEKSLLADLLITDSFTIKLVKRGLREVSCGYEAEYEEISRGKGRQTDIVGNHLALVEQGRAGSAYAINDEKRKGAMSKITDSMLEKLKKKFGAKVVDEAMKDEGEEKKDDKAKDEAKSYDELMKAVKDLGEKIEKMSEKKDDKAKDDMEASEDEEEEKSKDEDKEEAKDDEASLEERLKALEAAVAKLLESKDEDKSEDEESEEAKDEDKEEKKEKVGDEASRVEILAPGLKKVKGKDIKQEALKTAYASKDGKEVIDTITGKKGLTFDSKEKTEVLFVAAAELLKEKRGNGLEGTKGSKTFDQFDNKNEVMTAEKMNEMNQKYWDERNK